MTSCWFDFTVRCGLHWLIIFINGFLGSSLNVDIGGLTSVKKQWDVASKICQIKILIKVPNLVLNRLSSLRLVTTLRSLTLLFSFFMLFPLIAKKNYKIKLNFSTENQIQCCCVGTL